MRRLARRAHARLSAVAAAAGVLGLVAAGGCAAGPAGPAGHVGSVPAGQRGLALRAGTVTVSAFRRITLPDLLIVLPSGLTPADLRAIGAIRGVRDEISLDGGVIRVQGRPASAIGVDPGRFRAWVPLRLAADQPAWTALASGQFLVRSSSPLAPRLTRGRRYRLSGASALTVRYGGAAGFGIAGVDLVVDRRLSRSLGLFRTIAALVSAPGTRLGRVDAKVRAILGSSVKIVSLRAARQSAGRGLPRTYLELFRESAARYCPGLSWTVLAAIGQIESGDGRNNGPSSAGALGPMQFLPSTWAVWGTDGFGLTGPPDIMSPYDAVPSAARMLCADGAARGGRSLRQAIFDYNHAWWYVDEVLALAAGYRAVYG